VGPTSVLDFLYEVVDSSSNSALRRGTETFVNTKLNSAVDKSLTGHTQTAGHRL